MSGERVPAPPLLPEFAPPFGFAFRRLGWSVRSLFISGTRAPRGYRGLPWLVVTEFVALVLLLSWLLSFGSDAPFLVLLGAACAIVVVCFAVLLLLQHGLASLRPGRRIYVSRQRDAMLRVTARQKGDCGWHVDDHARAARRKGAGARLRAELVPVLIAAADFDHVDVYATAVTKDLAEAYMADVPGLVIVGRSRAGGYRLHRPARHYLRYAPKSDVAAVPSGAREECPAEKTS